MTTFVVCWTLLYGAHIGQQNCTPDMGIDQAQLIMATIVKAGESYGELSMRQVPTAPPGPMVTVSPPSN